MTKSAIAVPSLALGQVSTVKILGMCFHETFTGFLVFSERGITLGHCGQSSHCSQHRNWQDCTEEIIRVENVSRGNRREFNVPSFYYTNLVRGIVPMPGNNVKRRVVLFCLEKMPLTIKLPYIN